MKVSILLENFSCLKCPLLSLSQDRLIDSLLHFISFEVVKFFPLVYDIPWRRGFPWNFIFCTLRILPWLMLKPNHIESDFFWVMFGCAQPNQLVLHFGHPHSLPFVQYSNYHQTSPFEFLFAHKHRILLPLTNQPTNQKSIQFISKSTCAFLTAANIELTNLTRSKTTPKAAAAEEECFSGGDDIPLIYQYHIHIHAWR